MEVIKKETPLGHTFYLKGAEINAGDGEVFRYEDKDIKKTEYDDYWVDYFVHIAGFGFASLPQVQSSIVWNTEKGCVTLSGKVSEPFKCDMYVVPTRVNKEPDYIDTTANEIRDIAKDYDESGNMREARDQLALIVKRLDEKLEKAE